jgi:type IV pilus assembly protein PilB
MISGEDYKSFLQFDDDADDDEPVTSVDDFGSHVSEAAEEVEVEMDDIDDISDEFMASDAPSSNLPMVSSLKRSTTVPVISI